MEGTKPVPIPDSEKVLTAQKYKEEGNTCHKARNFKQAIGKYHRALLQLKAIGHSKSSGLGALLSDEDMQRMGHSSQVSPEMQAQVKKLQSDCYNNLSACLLQQEQPNYLKVLDYCEHVLELDPGNVKACYRKGMALYHSKQYERALSVLNEASATVQGRKDPSIRKYLQLCKKELETQEEELKAAYRSMFNRSSKEDQTAPANETDP